MMRVALTGGIASGKTTVSDTFASLGVPIADADILARVAVEVGSSGLEQITSRFGNSILQADGSLDRAKLRTVIFNDADARRDLEAIVHPEVRRLTNDLIESFEAAVHPYCLVVIPLLVETAQQHRYDHVVVVDVDADVQLHRLLQRDGSTEAEAMRILQSQASREERLAVADSVIHNNRSVEELQDEVRVTHKKLVDLAHQHAEK